MLKPVRFSLEECSWKKPTEEVRECFEDSHASEEIWESLVRM